LPLNSICNICAKPNTSIPMIAITHQTFLRISNIIKIGTPMFLNILNCNI
jgi:hypothetical protein